ncbi:MAG: cytidine deaminase [Christensenellales bacterium]|jgi:cytidine deaminase
MEQHTKKALTAAAAARKNAYAPYSNYSVGAALVAKDKSIHSGCNVECASYGATLCAERTALVKAVSEGLCEFELLAVVAEGNKPYPCGICRQMLYEFSPGMRIVVQDLSDNSMEEYVLKELLPKAFAKDG